jgi:amino acid transporter
MCAFLLFWPLYCVPFFYFDHCIVCLSTIFTVVLCVFLLFWPLYCVSFFYFDLCIVCLSSILTVVLCGRRKTHNTMVNIEERHTIQRSKWKKGTHYNGQNSRKAHNTRVKIEAIVLCVFLLFWPLYCVPFFYFWPLYCVPFFYFDHCIVCRRKTHNTKVKIEERHTIQWSK